MNARRLSIGLLSSSLLAGALALAHQPPAKSHEADGEQAITLENAPAAVRAAATRLAGDPKNISKVSREEDEEDGATFEIDYTDGGAACSAVFSTSGDLMELERPTTTEKLPAALMTALKKEYPKATFEHPQVVTKTLYEIEIVIDGKRHEIKADAAGSIEDHATDRDEEHDSAKRGEHGKGERHEGKKGADDKD